MTLTERKKSAASIRKVMKAMCGKNRGPQLLAEMLGTSYPVVWTWVNEKVDIPYKQAFVLSSISDATIYILRPDLEKKIKQIKNKLENKLDA